MSIALESSAIDILACFDHSKGSRSAIQSAVKALEQWSAYNIFSWTQRSAKNWLLTSREPTPVRRCNHQLQGTWTCCPNQILGVIMSNTFKWNCHVSDVINRANKLTHFLIMLKRVNTPTHDIMCFHITCIRPVFECCAPLKNHVRINIDIYFALFSWLLSINLYHQSCNFCNDEMS